MKINKIFFKVSLAIIVAVLFGCTNKHWYEWGQLGAKNECENQPPPAIESCRERIDKRPYEEYEKERTSSKQ